MAEDETIFEGDLKKEGVSPEKEEFLESEEHAESSDDVETKMHIGEKDADVYTEEGREELLEDDQVSPREEAFSEGATDRGGQGKCAACGKVLSQNQEEIIEREIDHKPVFFCSNECASKGKVSTS